MKEQANYKREIMQRFMTEEEIIKFDTDYFKAKLVNIGKIKVGKNPLVF